MPDTNQSPIPLSNIYQKTLHDEANNTLDAARRIAKFEGPAVEKSLEDFIAQAQKVKEELELKIREQFPSKKTFVTVNRETHPELFKVLDKMATGQMASISTRSAPERTLHDRLQSVPMYSAAWKSVAEYYRQNGLDLNVIKVPVDTDKDHEFRVQPLLLNMFITL